MDECSGTREGQARRREGSTNAARAGDSGSTADAGAPCKRAAMAVENRRGQCREGQAHRPNGSTHATRAGGSGSTPNDCRTLCLVCANKCHTMQDPKHTVSRAAVNRHGDRQWQRQRAIDSTTVAGHAAERQRRGIGRQRQHRSCGRRRCEGTSTCSVPIGLSCSCQTMRKCPTPSASTELTCSENQYFSFARLLVVLRYQLG
jgi:hypothetical protein